jgi:HAE1 family hydrophobic/amphiphilic exporter-1
MTTIAMVFGMFLIALATGAGAEEWFAWVIIGGLISSFPYFNSSTLFMK